MMMMRHILLKRTVAVKRRAATSSSILAGPLRQFSSFPHQLPFLNGPNSVKITGRRPPSPPPPPPPPPLSEVEQKILNYEFKNKSYLIDAFTLVPKNGESGNNGRQKILDYVFRNKSILPYTLVPNPKNGERGNNGRLTTHPWCSVFGYNMLDCWLVFQLLRCQCNLDVPEILLLRDANIRKDHLARVAFRHGLHRYIRHTSDQLDRQIKEYVGSVEDDKPIPPMKKPIKDVFSGLVKATVGAVWEDFGSYEEPFCEVLEGLMQPIIGPRNLVTRSNGQRSWRVVVPAPEWWPLRHQRLVHGAGCLLRQLISALIFCRN